MLVFGLLIVSVILKLKNHSNCEDVDHGFGPRPKPCTDKGKSLRNYHTFAVFVTLMLDNLIWKMYLPSKSSNMAFWVSIFKFQGVYHFIRLVGHHLKMYLLLKMVIFKPAILGIYLRVLVGMPENSAVEKGNLYISTCLSTAYKSNWDDAPSSTPSPTQRYDPEARIKFKPQQIPAPAAVVGYQGIVLHAKPWASVTPVTQLPGQTEIKHLWQKKLYVYIYIYIYLIPWKSKTI